MIVEPMLLIIVPRALAGPLDEYAKYKCDHDVSAEVVLLEDALIHAAAADGTDDAEKLKRYLYHRYRDANGLRYVLLVGDADALPVRYMVLDRKTEHAFNYAFYPSDLYYGDLAERDGSFEDWNAMRGLEGDSDGAFHATYFGEVRGEHFKEDPINFDKIDYRPEVAVGRWPVSTPEQVSRMVRKSIAYEKSLSRVDLPLMRSTAAFVAVGGWIENRSLMDASAALLPPGWGVERRYWRDPGSEPSGGDASAAVMRTPPPDEANVVELMNNGIGIILHSGHGWDDGWEQSLTAAALPQLQNADRLSIIFSAGCSTARFATLPPYEAYVDHDGNVHVGTNSGEVFTAPPPAPDCYQRGSFNRSGLGEKLLRDSDGGAVAYMGCNTGSQPCGMTLQEGFVSGVASVETARLGDCWNHAIEYYWERESLAEIRPNDDWYPASVFFQGMKFMLFGDPSLSMPAPGKLEVPVSGPGR